MIKKRLLELLEDALKYIKEQIIWKVLGLISQIVIVICISSIISKVVTVGMTLINGREASVSAGSFIKYIVPAIICIVLRFIFDKKETESSFNASADVKKILRQKIYDKLLSLGSSYKEKVSSAEVTQLMTEGVDQLETYFGLYLSQLFYALIAPVILFIVTCFISIRAAVILLVFVPLIPISIVVVQKIAKRLLNRYWSMYASLGDSFLDNIQGLTTLKIYQSDQYAANKMDSESEHFRNVTMKVLTMQLNSTSVMDIMAYGGAAAGIIVSLSEYSKNSITLSGALTIILLAAEFFLPMRRLGSYFHIAMNGMAASDKIFNLLDLEEPMGGEEDFPEDADCITFDKVFFSYDKNTNDKDSSDRDIGNKDDSNKETSNKEAASFGKVPVTDTALSPSDNPDDIGLINRQKEKGAVLKAVNMKIPKGSFTAIVGVSGSGKSTIASLLMGRQKNYQGSIKIGDKEISLIKENELFKNITLVSSGAILFKGTIRDNLAIAGCNRSKDKECASNESAEQKSAHNESANTITDELMLEALKKVNLLTLNSNAAENILDMEILENASNLSGGQKQRLAIARALLHDTDIYIFDEATSNIDAESEEMIMTAIKDIAKDHTVILITHRLANVVDADKIYMLKDGCIQEEGTHKELMNHFGSYALLFNAQQKLENYNGGKCKTGKMPVHKAAATSGNAAAIQVPISESKNDRNKKNLRTIKDLASLVKPLMPIMILAITLGVLGFLCAVFLTVRAAMILAGGSAAADSVSGNITAISFSRAAAISLVIMAVLRGLLHYAEQYCNHFIAFKLLALIRHKVFSALRRLSPAKLEGRDKGNIIAILTSDIELLEVFYAHTISPVFIAIIMTIIMVIFEWRIYPVAGVIALIAYIVVGVVIPVINGKRGSDEGREYRENFGELNSYVLESLRGLDETIQYGSGEIRQKAIIDKSTKLTTISKKLSEYQGDQTAVTDITIQISSWIMLLAVIYAGSATFENPGHIIIAVVAIMSSFGPVIALSNLSNNLVQTMASAARVLDLLKETPVVSENTDGKCLYPKVESIYTDNISFTYGKEPVLKDLSIGFPRGQILGIHGPSGCGKSTLLKLLMRFWDVSAGSVRIIASETDPTAGNEDQKDVNKGSGTDSKDRLPNADNTGLKGSDTADKSQKSSTNKGAITEGNPADNESPTEPKPPKPMTAIEMLKAMQAAKEEQIRVKKEHENAFLEKSKALAKQKEEARKKAALEAEKVEKQNRMTLLQRINSLMPKAEDKERSKDIKDVQTKSLRHLESYVTQDTYIFHDTIAANIGIGRINATLEEIQDAAKKASLHDFIMSLPDKYETQVGELGDTLSGGERQRIGIARAFLADADIILLDEPTSNLDSLNEGIILKSLKEASKDKTVIIVSHRDSTMAVADNVYSFEQ
ncbi:ATP-binding cassette domain-containing protein [Butyrivibrio fibrisolvens]|uniref:ATP-binding cassette domain-containing protein n=1 Tax=Butyrivibrio fibrisolvens TaxID=831 RepID=UPI0003B74FC2|nr:ATP-binding cassette domain-containing protein [Butyrivibrio fibrisolvens]